MFIPPGLFYSIEMKWIEIHNWGINRKFSKWYTKEHFHCSNFPVWMSFMLSANIPSFHFIVLGIRKFCSMNSKSITHIYLRAILQRCSRRRYKRYTVLVPRFSSVIIFQVQWLLPRHVCLFQSRTVFCFYDKWRKKNGSQLKNAFISVANRNALILNGACTLNASNIKIGTLVCMVSDY